MKKSFLLFSILVFSLFACKDSGKKKSGGSTLPGSNGTINSLAVVIEDSLWKGETGEVLREYLTSPVSGLPQDEPLFSLSNIPTKAFSGFTRNSRIFIKVEQRDKPGIKIVNDTFASPQTGVYLAGKNAKDIKKIFEKHAGDIIQSLKKTEIKANIQRISKSLLDDHVLQEKFGLSLKIPSAYRYAVEEDDFVWLRKDIRHGSMEILVYEVPLEAIDKDTNTVGNIVSMRDSIGEKYIPGPEKGSHMVTEKSYAPFLYNSTISGKKAFLTKGTWEVKDVWMAGPFINYAVRDEENDRYLILEGFVFKPQTPTKRNNVFELQAIFKSAKIK